MTEGAIPTIAPASRSPAPRTGAGLPLSWPKWDAVGAVRPPARLTSLLAVGSALLAAATAAAAVNDSVQFGAPSGGRQQLAVTMSDDAAITPTTLYATYRPVNAAHPPPTTSACAPTAANADARLIDGVTEPPGSYSVTESISLPLGLYAVCTYRATPASTDPASPEDGDVHQPLGDRPPLAWDVQRVGHRDPNRPGLRPAKRLRALARREANVRPPRRLPRDDARPPREQLPRCSDRQRDLRHEPQRNHPNRLTDRLAPR